MERKNKIIVIAANARHAYHWAHEHRVQKDDYVYIDSPRQLQGLNLANHHVIYVPGFWEHPHSGQIEDFIKIYTRHVDAGNQKS